MSFIRCEVLSFESQKWDNILWTAFISLSHHQNDGHLKSSYFMKTLLLIYNPCKDIMAEKTFWMRSLNTVYRVPKSTTFSFDDKDLLIFKHISKTHCASNNWPIGAQKVPKETKIFVLHERSAVKNSFSIYICMLCPGRFILDESVYWKGKVETERYCHRLHCIAKNVHILSGGFCTRLLRTK